MKTLKLLTLQGSNEPRLAVGAWTPMLSNMNIRGGEVGSRFTYLRLSTNQLKSENLRFEITKHIFKVEEHIKKRHVITQG